MPRAKRKHVEGADEQETLPTGIVSRVQLTRYKIAAGGIQTVPIAYQPLTKEINAVGFVEFDERKLARITARATGKSRIDKLLANETAQTVQKGEALAALYSPHLFLTVQNPLHTPQVNNA